MTAGVVGAAVFFCIGICHPAVIKMEYHLGKKSWWVWLVVGLLVAVTSLFVSNQTVSTILGGFAFSCFWGLMAFMMKRTEEKWLHNLYGAEYDAYCERVNRTWPWFPRK